MAMKRVALAIAIMVLVATRSGVAAAAPARVVVLGHDESLPPAFLASLRIQLTGVGVVEEGPPLQGERLAEQVAFATELVQSEGFAMAVWLDAPAAGEPRQHVLYVVGEQGGRALVEVFELPDKEGAAADRAMALKVREVLDTILLPQESPPTVAEWVGREAPKKAPSTVLLLDFSTRVSWNAGTFEPGLSVQLGPRWQLPLIVDAFAVLEVGPGVEVARDSGRVDTDRAGVGAGVRVSAKIAPVAVGASAAVVARLVRAEGVTPAGAKGAETVVLPTLVAAAEARWPARSGVQGRVSTGLQLAAIRQVFAVNEQPVADLGRVAPLLEVGLAVSF